MLRTTIKIVRFSFFGLLIVLGVTFAVSNRARVDLTFFPLPYSLSVPLFIVTLLMFIAGAFTAWVILRFSSVKERMQHRKTQKRMLAVENEITALRSEQLVRQQQAVKPLSLVK